MTNVRRLWGRLSRPSVFLPVLIAAVFLVYANGLHGPLQFDDTSGIVGNRKIADLAYFFGGRIDGYNPFREPRYLGWLSFALNYRLHYFDVTGYHAVNVAIHALNAALVYLLARLLLRTPLLEELPRRFVPAAASLLFALHPLQTEAVTYVVQRFTSLAAFFYLGSVVCYLRFRLGGRRAGWYLACLALAVLAMRTKEIAVTLPAAVTLVELSFWRGGPRRLGWILPLVAAAALVPLAFLDLGRPSELLARADLVTRVQTALPRLEYLATQCRVIATYVRLLVLPVGQNLDYDYPIYRSFGNPSVFVPLLCWGALILGSVRLLMRRETSGLGRLFAFGVLWFFLTLSVESSVIPIIDLIFEHRLYLPSVGAFLAGAALLGLLAERPRWRLLVPAGTAVAVLALGGATVARNAVWANGVKLWEDTARKSPRKARVYLNLGDAYEKAGEPDKAVEAFTKTISLHPSGADAYAYRAALLFKIGRREEAMRDFDRALAEDPHLAVAYGDRGVAYVQLGRMQEALLDLDRAVAWEPSSGVFLLNRGQALESLGRYPDALADYDRALAVDPNLARAYDRRGAVELRLGRTRAAVADFDQALRRNPWFAQAYMNRGNAWDALGDPRRALADYDRAISLEPGNGTAYFNRGLTRQRLGNVGAAAADYKKGCDLGDGSACAALLALPGAAPP